MRRCIAAIVFLIVCHNAESQVILSGDPNHIPPNPHKKDPSTSGTISIGTPDLSDEDSMSLHMPNYLKCDACRILAMRFGETFRKEIDKYPSIKQGKKELTEDRVMDLLEKLCAEEWTQYGIKEVEGINRLSGPGFETEEIPGIMQGGGKWPFRFKEMCEIMLGDIGEDVVYETYRKGKISGLEKLLCFSPIEGRTGFCEKKSGKIKKSKNAGKPKDKTQPKQQKIIKAHQEL